MHGVVASRLCLGPNPPTGSKSTPTQPQHQPTPTPTKPNQTHHRQGFLDAAKSALDLRRVDAKRYTKAPRGGGVFTTPALDRAAAGWRDAAEAAADAARARLKALAVEVTPRLHSVGVAASASVLLQALLLHARQALPMGWVLPRLVSDGSGDGSSGSSNGVGPSHVDGVTGSSGGTGRPSLVLEGVWPYWMDVRGGAEGSNGRLVVSNDVELSGMALLTGPNMAGGSVCCFWLVLVGGWVIHLKFYVLIHHHSSPSAPLSHTKKPSHRTPPTGKSTALRTICATALLANCGLLAPARSAAVPHFTHYALKNFSGDAPAEGMSAFGVEMRDMT